MDLETNTNVNTRTHTCTYTHMYTQVIANWHTCTHTHAHINTYVHPSPPPTNVLVIFQLNDTSLSGKMFESLCVCVFCKWNTKVCVVCAIDYIGYKAAAGSNIVAFQVATIVSKALRDKDYKRPAPFPYQESQYGLIAALMDKTTHRFDENSKIIVVDGPIAAGKTKFAKVCLLLLELPVHCYILFP